MPQTTPRETVHISSPTNGIQMSFGQGQICFPVAQCLLPCLVQTRQQNKTERCRSPQPQLVVELRIPTQLFAFLKKTQHIHTIKKKSFKSDLFHFVNARRRLTGVEAGAVLSMCQNSAPFLQGPLASENVWGILSCCSFAVSCALTCIDSTTWPGLARSHIPGGRSG